MERCPSAKVIFFLLGVTVLLVGVFLLPAGTSAGHEKPVVILDNSPANNELFVKETEDVWRSRLGAVREHLACDRTFSDIGSIRAAEGLSLGDLTFTLTPEEKTLLNQAENLYRGAENILTRAEVALQDGDLKTVAGEWESLRTTVNTADQTLNPIRDRWLEVTEPIRAERMFHEASPWVGVALFSPIIAVAVIAVILALKRATPNWL